VRIVHTSDWHAGRVWNTIDRLPELAAVLEDLGDFAERERIDLLLMSGDVFDSGAPSAEAERLVFGFLKRVGRTGAHTVVIAGNHDQPARLEAWGLLAELVNVHAVGRPRRADAGGVIEVETRTGERTAIACVPFAPARGFVSALELAASEAEAHQRYADSLKAVVEHLAERFRPNTVNLLVAHTHLEGAVVSGSERQVHIGEQWAATPQALPPRAHYVALGHIHKPQSVGTAPAPTCYAGSPLQLDFGEAGEEKSFVVIEARPRQPARIERVPYRGGRALRDVGGYTPQELEARAAELRELGWLRVTVPFGEPDPDLNSRVKRLLPNAVIVRVERPQVDPVTPLVSTKGVRPADLYRAYHRATHGRDASDALVSEFERLWAEADSA
jgi:DNA repair protein SbcD/Mre11